MNLLYLHGFNSSPDSTKAKIFQSFVKKKKSKSLLVPDLPISPRESILLLEEIIKDHKKEVSLIGSSLGGFYAAYLAEKYKLKSVLINPVVSPHLKNMKDLIGEHENYNTGEKYFFSKSNFKELFDYKIRRFSIPLDQLFLLQLGDEVLDQKKTLKHNKDSFSLVEDEGSHKFENFEKYLPLIYDFTT